MAQFADRVAYRLAGLVWTAIYSGLAGSSGATRSAVESLPSLAAPAPNRASGQAVAAQVSAHLKINEFLHRARAGRVRIVLTDGQVHTGHFRTDILSPSALSAFFFGDVRPLSLFIDAIVSVEALPAEQIAS